IHQPFVSIREQAVLLAGRLKGLGRASFRQLTAGAANNYEIVASFLALLELYREDTVAFEQVTPLGELYVSWTGGGAEGRGWPRGDREVVLAPPGAGRDIAAGDGDAGDDYMGDGDCDDSTTESEEEYT